MSRFKEITLRVWSIPYVKHPLLALVGGGVLVGIVFLFLNVFTEHGAEYDIPDFRGVALEDARVMASPLDLRLSIADSTYSPLLKPHAVIDQYPRVGSMVKHRRRVYLTINSQRPEIVAFPRRAWEPYRTAFAAVQESKLQVGRISFINAAVSRSDDAMDDEPGAAQLMANPTGEFIGHTEVQKWQYNGRELRPGDSLYAGSLVDVILGLDASRQTETSVPNVKGQTLENARAMLVRSLVNVGRVTYDAATVRTLGDSINAVVARQGYPERADAGVGIVRSRVQYGTPIDLHLSVPHAQDEEER